MGIKTLLPFLRNVTEESSLDDFRDLIAAVDASCWLHKAIASSLSRFGDERRCDFSRITDMQLGSFSVVFVVQMLMFFILGRKRYVVPTWICSSPKRFNH